jgi:hypothetical protein
VQAGLSAVVHKITTSISPHGEGALKEGEGKFLFMYVVCASCDLLMPQNKKPTNCALLKRKNVFLITPNNKWQEQVSSQAHSSPSLPLRHGNKEEWEGLLRSVTSICQKGQGDLH